jgi:hypothetical protein
MFFLEQWLKQLTVKKGSRLVLYNRILKFQASSEPELILWVMSFKDEARMAMLKWLVPSAGKLYVILMGCINGKIRQKAINGNELNDKTY